MSESSKRVQKKANSEHYRIVGGGGGGEGRRAKSTDWRKGENSRLGRRKDSKSTELHLVCILLYFRNLPIVLSRCCDSDVSPVNLLRRKMCSPMYVSVAIPT